MKILLPNEENQFEVRLNHMIETIQACQMSNSFFQSFIELIQTLRSNPVTVKWIQELEQEDLDRKKKFNSAALEVLEQEWLFLWRMHKGLNCRRVLIRIKRSLTNSEYSSHAPFEHVCFSLRHLKSISPILKRIQKTKNIFKTVQRFFEEKIRTRKNLPIKWSTQKYDSQIHKKGPILFSSNTSLLEGRVMTYDEHLCSPKFNFFFKEYPQLSMSSDIKRQYIQTMEERDPVFFWGRLCMLEKILQNQWNWRGKETLKGEWQSIRKPAWQASIDASSDFMFSLAKNLLFGGLDNINFKAFLSSEYYFSRKGCERHLQQLKRNVKTFLLNQQLGKSPPAPASFILQQSLTKRIAKELEVANHATAYWNTNPKAKQEEVYEDYKRTRLSKDYYSPNSWVKIIRNRKLDPRPLKKKTRGKGKKGL